MIDKKNYRHATFKDKQVSLPQATTHVNQNENPIMPDGDIAIAAFNRLRH